MPFCEIALDDRPVMSSPLKKMRPEVGRSTPVRQLKKVLLPAPFGPMMARISSRATSKLTLLTRGQAAETDGQQFGAQDGDRPPLPGLVGRGGPHRSQAAGAHLRGGELAGRREHRLFAGYGFDDAVLAVLDVEDDLAAGTPGDLPCAASCRRSGSRRSASSRSPSSASISFMVSSRPSNFDFSMPILSAFIAS